MAITIDGILIDLEKKEGEDSEKARQIRDWLEKQNELFKSNILNDPHLNGLCYSLLDELINIIFSLDNDQPQLFDDWCKNKALLGKSIEHKRFLYHVMPLERYNEGAVENGKAKISVENCLNESRAKLRQIRNVKKAILKQMRNDGEFLLPIRGSFTIAEQKDNIIIWATLNKDGCACSSVDKSCGQNISSFVNNANAFQEKKEINRALQTSYNLDDMFIVFKYKIETSIHFPTTATARFPYSENTYKFKHSNITDKCGKTNTTPPYNEVVHKNINIVVDNVCVIDKTHSSSDRGEKNENP